ncbi:MAG: adenylate/guanylate cyclase domain-containing protein [Rhodospirillales bacterium]|nr:adenylate/guanylate cyclase domain-containing protein [Rhodospirillales bacterium]
MRITRRDRRDVRLFLWFSLAAAVISAYFGYAVAPASEPPRAPLQSAFHGALTSLMIATPIILFELGSRRPGLLRRLRRLPLVAYFSLKVLFYSVVIIAGLLVMRPSIDAVFRTSLVFSIAMAIFANVIIEIGGLLGYGTLKGLLTGRYVQPRREQRAFLLIDMKDSTRLAERLGPIRFHELLNDFFRDVSDAAFETQAEIHKYVGDEAILTWTAGKALADGDFLACPFIVRDLIAGNGDRYRRRFGVVPAFRASLHCGEIVAGEIGDARREIAYVGDTLNVAARLLEAAKARGRDILVSADLLEAVALPADLVAEPLPTLAIRGRNAPLEIFALARVGQK